MLNSKKIPILIMLAVFLCISTVGTVAAEDSTGMTVISPNRDVNLTVANDDGARFDDMGNDTYNFFNTNQGPTQGMNELHISTNTGNPYGNVASSANTSGTFYVSNTGGRGWNDNIILMLAINGTIPDNFEIIITSSGYVWTPVDRASIPAYDALTYNYTALNETFYKSDFIYGPQIWKPAPGLNNYNVPIFYGQNMADTSNNFSIMFIDLYAGILKESLYSGLIDSGMLKVQYTLQNLTPGQLVAFNVYGYSNDSNQGQGIRWTNRVVDTGSSGYTVTIPEKPDLEAIDLSIPEETQIGNTSPLNVTIINNGGSSSAFTVKFYDGSTGIAWINVDGLAAGASTVVTCNWKPNTIGSHDIKAIVDYYNTVVESNEYNNIITEVADVGSSPDLVVSNIQLPENPQIGHNTYPVSVTVTNNSEADIVGPFTVKFYDGSTGIAWKTVEGLAAGASTIVSFNWKPTTTGTHNIQARADYYNTVPETNESNNSITATTNVTTKPDLTISNLQLPETPTANQTYPISVTVTNNSEADIVGSFTVKFYDGSTGIAWINVDGLAAGASTVVTCNWKPTTTGTHNIQARADYYNTITETNETNNTYTQEIIV